MIDYEQLGELMGRLTGEMNGALNGHWTGVMDRAAIEDAVRVGRAEVVRQLVAALGEQGLVVMRREDVEAAIPFLDYAVEQGLGSWRFEQARLARKNLAVALAAPGDEVS